MPEVKYGNTTIHYELSIEPQLKNTYIQVEQGKPVLFRTPLEIEGNQSNKEVLKKGRWVLQKLALVAEPYQETIRTGSRLPYFGRRYYVEMREGNSNKIEFKSSKFFIQTQNGDIETLLEAFYRSKCIEKIKPRVNRWIAKTGLKPSSIKFRKLEKRWGSCTQENNVIFSTETAKLPWDLIDYLIVHELCHIKHKDHTKAFWKEIEKHIPDYATKDERMNFFEL